MLKKVVVIGPESTGKSTLAQQLAMHYSCKWVPEYAREYLEHLDRPYRREDLLQIAIGQISLEESLSHHAKHLLICDTDLHVIQVWSHHKFGTVDKWITQQLESRDYDLYLLTDIDIPWEDDPLREHPLPDQRRYFLELYKEVIGNTGVPYEIISGSQDERLFKAIKRINILLGA